MPRYIRRKGFHLAIIACAGLALAQPSVAQPRGGRQAAAKADEDRARDLNNVAAALHNNGQSDRALVLYNRVITLNPRAAVYYNNRAAARDKMGDLAGALADYDTALRIDPRPAVFYSNRASLLLKKSDFYHAIRDYDLAVKAEPKTGFFRQERGKAHLRRGDTAAALRDLRDAFRLDPQLKTARDMAEALAASPPKPAPSLGQDPPGTGRRVALVIGNGAYATLGRLKNPTRDADDVAAELRKLGFSSVRLVRDGKLDEMESALNAFADEASAADWALIYYAGHGVELAGVNYLLPVNLQISDNADLQNAAIPLDRVLSTTARAAKLRLVVLDACRDAPLPKKMKETVALKSVSRGLAPNPVPRQSATLVAYSAKGGEVAEDGDGANSPYTTALLKRLKVRGLEISRMFNEIRDEVLSVTNNAQEPFTYGSLPAGEPFVFQPI